MRYLYDYGLPFSERLAENIDEQLNRLENKRASCILIDGAVGTGKTTMAVHLMEYINKKLGSSQVALKVKDHPQLSLGGQEFISCFRKCHSQNLKVITYDEAGDFSRRGAISRFNGMINRLFETYRGFRILVIICLPNFNILDSLIFDNQIPRMLIHIVSRSKNQGDFSVYSLDQMNWVRHWYDKLCKGNKNKCYSITSPHFRGHFLNLPPDREKELDKLSTYGKKQLLKNVEKRIRGLLTISEVANKVNRSIIWTRNKIKELKIKPKQRISNAYMYDQNAVDRLADFIETRVSPRLKEAINTGIPGNN